jgi:hypothetical protein
MAASQNSLKMQRTFLTLIVIAVSTVTTDNNFYHNMEDQQIALCIQIIVHQYFARGLATLFSMSSDELPTGRSLHSLSPYDNNFALVSLTLTKLHDNVSWPLRLFPPEITLHGGVVTTHS